MKKIKILFFHPNLSNGGAERVLTHMVNNFDRSIFDISLLLADKSGVFLDDIKKDVSVSGLKEKKLRIIGAIKLFLFVKKNKPDIIFSNYTRYNSLVLFFKSLWSKKMKIVIRETGVPTQTYFKNKPYILWMYKLFINNASLIIAQSDDMFTGITNVYKPSPKIVVKINNPIDFEKINNKLSEDKNLLFSKDKINILGVGWLEPQKGFDLLIERFAELKNVNNYHLSILGTGKDETYLKEIASQKGISSHISFLGFDSNPYLYMKNCDIFISSSRHEGFPNAVIEALACGTPVVSNRYLGGISEIIIENKNGLFFNIYEANSLEDIISKFYQTKFWISDEISQNAFDRWNKNKIINDYQSEILKTIKNASN